MIEPVGPFERRIRDSLEVTLGSAPIDYLKLVKTVARLGQSVLIAVADTAGQWLDTGLDETLGVFARIEPVIATRCLSIWARH